MLATVASTVYAFTQKHPNALIVATGSTSIRTRLYRMGITNNLDETSEDFIIFGYTTDERWVAFEIGEDYEAFLVIKKKINFSMTIIEKLNKSKIPIIPIDKRLEKYRGKVLFPEKLAKANEIIAKSGIPKQKK